MSRPSHIGFPEDLAFPGKEITDDSNHGRGWVQIQPEPMAF
jgi:hypothetical protein